jgi:hypothetical protein
MKNSYQLITVLSLALLLAACGSSSKDPDADGDGVADKHDVFPQDARESKDSDDDGIGDNADAFPTDATETLDTDNDTIGDNTDNCPTVANTNQTNQDNDSAGDACDVFPQDTTETEDSDNDGVGDNSDVFPTDATETIDTDNDTIGNNADNCPNTANTNQINTDANFENGDIFGDACDADDDNDNTLDVSDIFPLDPAESIDEDIDGIGDNKDLDIDSPKNQEENSISLTRLLATGRATRFIGPQANSNFSYINNKTVNAGDVNNDGFDDMLVSIPGYKQDPAAAHYTGIVYLFFGGQTPWPQTIDLTNIPASVPHVIFEKQSTDDSHTFLGFSLAALGDVNGDSIDDFAISAYKANSSTLGNAGAVHIVYGRTTWLADAAAAENHTISYASLKADYALSFYGDVADANIGFSIANVGDFNGDGVADIAMGQPRYNSAGATLVGRIYILFGGAQFNQPVGTITAIAAVPEAQRLRITGSDEVRGQLGYYIMPLANFDNDINNTHDVLAMSASTKEGIVIFGQKNPPANIELTIPMTTDYGFVIDGAGRAFDDVAVGNLLADDSNAQEILLIEGLSTYIIKGGVGNWPASIDTSNLPEEYGTVGSFQPSHSTNISATILPDSNQDGLDEPLISTPNTDDDMGRVLKIKNTAKWITEPSTPLSVDSNIQNIINDVIVENTFFRTLSVLGDMDSDGQQEFVLNAWQTPTINGTASGDFYVVKGFASVYPK